MSLSSYSLHACTRKAVNADPQGNEDQIKCKSSMRLNHLHASLSLGQRLIIQHAIRQRVRTCQVTATCEAYNMIKAASIEKLIQLGNRSRENCLSPHRRLLVAHNSGRGRIVTEGFLQEG